MREITKIIIHCTATRPGQDVTVDIITRWHKQRGFRTIGYHYFIDYDGHIHEGRPLSQAGAHVRGHNATSIGIAFAGGLDDHCKPADTRTPEQTQALLQLLRQLHQQFPNATIHGHYEFQPNHAHALMSKNGSKQLAYEILVSNPFAPAALLLQDAIASYYCRAARQHACFIAQ